MSEQVMIALEFVLDMIKNPEKLVHLAGYWGLAAIIFAETGILAGFFFPGDSLLFVTGLIAATGELSIYILIPSLTLAAILGDAVGYFIGRNLGHHLYEKKESFFFRRQHLLAAEAFYKKYGPATIVLARFVPIARTFVPTVAGAAKMEYRRFAVYNILGAFLWVWSLTLLGFFFGKLFGETLTTYLHLIIFAIVVLSILPGVVKVIQARREMRKNNPPPSVSDTL